MDIGCCSFQDCRAARSGDRETISHCGFWLGFFGAPGLGEGLRVEGWAAGMPRHVTRSPFSCVLPSHVVASSCVSAQCPVLGRRWATLVGAVK